MDEYILLIDGPDQPGLIHKITGTIFYQGLNITSNSEFVDQKTNHFFMRSEFMGDLNCDNLLAGLKNALSGDYNIKLTKQIPKKIAVMVTKEHHCLADVLIRHEFKKINADIQCVIGNHEDLRPLVERFDLPFHFVSHNDKEREEHEKEVMKILDKYALDYLVLAKYMRILTPEFVKKFKNKIVNIHHSFLPAFIGANPYEQAFERGVKIIGATSHFVNEELDQGPIIVQEILNVDHSFDAQAMKRAGQDAEVLALAKALHLVFEDRVFINGNKTVVFK